LPGCKESFQLGQGKKVEGEKSNVKIMLLIIMGMIGKPEENAKGDPQFFVDITGRDC
jgi:hypothetical protein